MSAQPGAQEWAAGPALHSNIEIDTQLPASMPSVVRQACIAWGITQASVHFVKYRENWVFRVDTASGSCALRLHRPGYQTRAAIECEMELLTVLGEAGIAVPDPIVSAAGLLVEQIIGPDQVAFFVDLQRWIPDMVQLGDVTDVFVGAAVPSVAEIEKVGELAARMHEAIISAQQSGRLNADARLSWDCAGLVGLRPLWGDPLRLAENEDDKADLRRAMSRIGQTLAALPAGPGEFGLLHGDLTFENLLWGSAGLTVIDFDDAGSGWYLFDLATVLGFLTSHPDYPRYEVALFEGYQRVRAISDAQLAAWPSLLLARMLTYLGWAADRRGDEAAEFLRDDFMPHVISMARGYLTAGQRE